MLAALLLGMAVPGAQAGNISFTYDNLGRVTSANYPDGTQIVYTYDAAGNRTQQVTGTTGTPPPIAINDTITVPHNTAYTFDPRVNDSDPDGYPLSVSGATNGAHGTANANPTNIVYTPTTGYSGPDSFTYAVSDTHGGSALGTVTVTVQ